jgi:hypothetical protein
MRLNIIPRIIVRQLCSLYSWQTCTHHPCRKFDKSLQDLIHRAVRTEEICKDESKGCSLLQQLSHNAHPGWLCTPAQMHRNWMSIQYPLHSWDLQYNIQHIIQVCLPFFTSNHIMTNKC